MCTSEVSSHTRDSSCASWLMMTTPPSNCCRASARASIDCSTGHPERLSTAPGDKRSVMLFVRGPAASGLTGRCALTAAQQPALQCALRRVLCPAAHDVHASFAMRHNALTAGCNSQAVGSQPDHSSCQQTLSALRAPQRHMHFQLLYGITAGRSAPACPGGWWARLAAGCAAC